MPTAKGWLKQSVTLRAPAGEQCTTEGRERFLWDLGAIEPRFSGPGSTAAHFPWAELLQNLRWHPSDKLNATDSRILRAELLECKIINQAAVRVRIVGR